jgi:hypothetical protein
MNDISSGKISCLCGWEGTINDVPIVFDIPNFLICPKCGTEDLIYASKPLEKKFHQRKVRYLCHTTESLVYAESNLDDLVNSGATISIFVNIRENTYLFSTISDLSEIEVGFKPIEITGKDIEKTAQQTIEELNIKTTNKLEGDIDHFWGKTNFATVLALYSEISEQISKDIDQQDAFEFNF